MLFRFQSVLCQLQLLFPAIKIILYQKTPISCKSSSNNLHYSIIKSPSLTGQMLSYTILNSRWQKFLIHGVTYCQQSFMATRSHVGSSINHSLPFIKVLYIKLYRHKHPVNTMWTSNNQNSDSLSYNLHRKAKH